MKKKTIQLILIIMVMMMVASACYFTGRKTATPEPTPTATATPIPPTPNPDIGMQLYYGSGMQIMLPSTYIAQDIKTELPNILETITNLIGSSEGFLGDLVKNLEKDVAWYGYDGGTPAVYPTRLVVIKNQSLARTPVSLITLALEQLLGRDSAQVDRDSLTLNDRDVTRFTYSMDGNAWAAYLFKAEDQLWLSVFITTPANLAASLAEYDSSIGSMQIDPLQ